MTSMVLAPMGTRWHLIGRDDRAVDGPVLTLCNRLVGHGAYVRLQDPRYHAMCKRCMSHEKTAVPS